jgi:tetratricopeptide (TPR) repeat protein
MAQAHNGLALQQLSHGKPESARQSALAAIRCDSTFTAAHTTLGLALFQQRKYETAIAAYRKALQANPTAQLYNNFGAAQEANGELAAAVEAYRRALELETGLASAQKNLQRAQEKLAMAGDAEKPATVDTEHAIPIRRDSLVLATPALAERSSKSRRAKSGKVEPAAKAPQNTSSALTPPSTTKANPVKSKKARRHGRTPEKSPLPSMPLAAKAPNSSMPSPADSAAAPSIPSVTPSSGLPIKSVAFASAVVLMILAFAQRRRLSHVWLQLQPVLATSTAEVSRQVRRLLSQI